MWDEVAVHVCFEPHVASQVLSIPLSRRYGQDRVAWKLNKIGFFSVKSAYTIARDFSIGNIFAHPPLEIRMAQFGEHCGRLRFPTKWPFFGRE